MEKKVTCSQKDVFQGIVVDQVIATTMSVDISEIICLCGQICFPKIQTLNSMNICQALSYLKDKLWVFYDKRNTHNMVDDKSNLSSKKCVVADQFVYPVDCEAPCFHPKIILVRYHEPNDGGQRYRLLVSSKNLTFGRGIYEVACILYGQVGDCEIERNHNLPELVKYLADKSKIKAKDTFKEIEAELKKVQFKLMDPEQVKEAEINVIVSGINGKTQSDLGLALCFAKDNYSKKEKDNWFILSPDYETADEMLKKFPVYKPLNLPTHAKLYFHCIDKNESELWIGSANLSDAGLNKNIECMVHIKGNLAKPQINEDDNKIKFWGAEFIRVTDSKIRDTDWCLHGELIKFLDNHNFTMDESCIAKKNKDEKKRRKVTVEVSPPTDEKYTLSDDYSIFILPFGMNEVKRNGDSKWVQWNKEKPKYRFQGFNMEHDPATGYLRIRICDKKGEKYETTICVKPEIGTQLLENNINDSEANFLERNWFQEILINRHYNDERIKAEIAIVRQTNSAKNDEIAALMGVIEHYMELRSAKEEE